LIHTEQGDIVKIIKEYAHQYFSIRSGDLKGFAETVEAEKLDFLHGISRRGLPYPTFLKTAFRDGFSLHIFL
jgi:hypothetical protein